MKKKACLIIEIEDNDDYTADITISPLGKEELSDKEWQMIFGKGWEITEV